MSEWATAYAGCDDEAIIALANAGLLRRGRKDVVAGLVEVVEESPAGVVASVGAAGARVRLNAKGPAAASCDCATAGTCQHIVSALLWARDLAPTGDAPSPDPAPPPPAKKASPSAAAARKVAAESRRADAIAEVREAVAGLLTTGLAHVGPDDAEHLLGIAGRAKAASFGAVNGVHLPVVLRTVAGIVEELAAHSDTVDEAEAVDAVAELWALAEVLGATPSATDADPTTGEIDIPRLIPLGARWWTTPSGSRGVTLMGWDAGAARVRTVTTGRAAGTDPAFQRSWDRPLLWRAALSRLCAGPIELSGVRLNPDGTLGNAGQPRAATGEAFDTAELMAIAESTGRALPPREVVGFGRRPQQVRLMMLRDAGEIGVDEVRQEMTWSVTTSDGRPHLLRLPVLDGAAVDTLLSAIAGSRRVVAVTVERHEGHEEPVGLLVERPGGPLTLVCPSLTPHWELRGTSRWDAWRQLARRIESMRTQAVRVPTKRPAPSPAERACALTGDVLVAVAATGRLRLTSSQRADLVRARHLARDLGLRTLERAVTMITDGGEEGDESLSPESVLRTAFVVGRTRAVLGS